MVSTSSNRGLYVGEQSPDELEECLINPETRNVEQITVADVKKADSLLEILLGPSVPPRREYLIKYGEGVNV